MMTALKYCLAFVFVPLAASAFYFGGLWSFNLPVLVFIVLPLLELALPKPTENLSEEEEARILKSRFYDWALYLVVPAQVGLLGYYLHRVSSGSLDAVGLIGSTWTMGVCCGIFGINVAHELGHRHKPYEQFLAKVLLTTSLYLHFFIEHNRGHHVRIATGEDPASARRGEALYLFWFRSVIGAWVSAWKIENRRLRKRGLRWFSLRNQMLRFQIVQAAALAAAWIWFGAAGVLGFVASATLGFLMLETVNYIEHYGLERRLLGNGRYEKVAADHSWNSDHLLGRLILFELTRHSDHHLHASRKYAVLRHIERSPQMPTGYPGMMGLAMIPPLWFRVMDRRIEESRSDETKGGLSRDAGGREIHA